MMAGTTSHFTLNTGAKIPAVGFGTWKAGPGGKFMYIYGFFLLS